MDSAYTSNAVKLTCKSVIAILGTLVACIGIGIALLSKPKVKPSVDTWLQHARTIMPRHQFLGLISSNLSQQGMEIPNASGDVCVYLWSRQESMKYLEDADDPRVSFFIQKQLYPIGSTYEGDFLAIHPTTGDVVLLPIEESFRELGYEASNSYLSLDEFLGTCRVSHGYDWMYPPSKGEFDKTLTSIEGYSVEPFALPVSSIHDFFKDAERIESFGKIQHKYDLSQSWGFEDEIRNLINEGYRGFKSMIAVLWARKIGLQVNPVQSAKILCESLRRNPTIDDFGNPEIGLCGNAADCLVECGLVAVPLLLEMLSDHSLVHFSSGYPLADMDSKTLVRRSDVAAMVAVSMLDWPNGAWNDDPNARDEVQTLLKSELRRVLKRED